MMASAASKNMAKTVTRLSQSLLCNGFNNVMPSRAEAEKEPYNKKTVP